MSLALRFTILLCLLIPATSPQADTRDEIRVALDYYAELWNEGDFDALRGYYGPAFVQISTRGVESMSQRFDDINALSGAGGDPGDLTYDNLTIQPLGDGHAMAYGQLRLQFKDGSSIETWFSTVYEKTPFGWKAILAHQ